MSYSEQQDIKYFLSGLYQDIAIAIVVIILYLLVGTGIFEGTGAGEGEGVIEFNTFFLIFIIASMAIGSIIFYLIFTRLKALGIRIIYSIVLALPYLLLLYELIGLLYTQDLGLFMRVLIYCVTLLLPVFGFIFIYIYGKGSLFPNIRNIGIVISAGIIGRIMALYFDLFGLIVFAIFLSLFDIYSVFKGPLAKIMGEPKRIDQERRIIPPKELMDKKFSEICKNGTPVLLSYQNTLLGIGDVLFFAILMYNALIEWSWLGLAVTLIMIMIGSSGTLFLLKKISPLPGLPLPVLFSLLGYGALIQLENLQIV